MFLIILFAFAFASCPLTSDAVTCSSLSSNPPTLNVNEGTVAGTILYQFVGTTIDYASTTFFQVLSNNITVTTTVILTNSDSNVYILNTLCSDATSPLKSSIIIIMNIVNFYNALPPIWSYTTNAPTVTLQEYTAAGSFVFTATATDNDYQPGSVSCTYAFAPPILSQYFTVSTAVSSTDCTATISVSQMFDYQTIQKGTFLLTASEFNSSQTLLFSTPLNVSLTVLDIADKPPIFIGTPYYINTTSIGAQSFQVGVSAVDGNTGLNGSVSLSVIGCSSSPNPFSSSISGGLVTAQQALSWGTAYYLLVQASLDSAPWLTNYETIQVTVGPAPTTVTSTTPTTTTGTTLPYQLLPCGSTSSSSSISTVPVTISSLQPVMNPSVAFQVMGNAPAGFMVADLTDNLLVYDSSSDQNSSMAAAELLFGNLLGAQYTVSFLSGPVDFTVNQSSGLLTVSNQLDYETNSAYTLMVTVRLVYANTSSAQSAASLVNISVVNTDNFAPNISTASVNITLPYSVSSATTLLLIGQVNASDPDTNGSLVFNSFDYNGTFFVASNGSIWLINTANLVYGTPYHFLVTASDNWWPQPRFGGASASVYIQPQQSNQTEFASIGWIALAAGGGCLLIVLLIFTILAIKQTHPVHWSAEENNATSKYPEAAMNGNVQQLPSPLPQPPQLTATPVPAPASTVISHKQLLSPSPSDATFSGRAMNFAAQPHVPRASIQFSDESDYGHPIANTLSSGKNRNDYIVSGSARTSDSIVPVSQEDNGVANGE